MEKVLLSGLSHLTEDQKATLRKGNVNTVADLLLTPVQDLVRRCRVSHSDIIHLTQATCNNQGKLALRLRTLEDMKPEMERTFSIGDDVLDIALGGGLRPGMVWEIVGESAAGKTQFALQSALYVQLPPTQHGLGGSACYLATSAKLQTARLLQIQQTRGVAASLENVHTLSTPTVPILLNVLENQLPSFIETTAKSTSHKPVRLLIIDALAELFHSFDKITTATMVERSQQLTQISTHLHRLATQYKLAVVILNEVTDVFDNYAMDSTRGENGMLVYAEQTRWFSRAHSVFGQNQKEASLGLVWANQINARIMLTRTGRRKYIEEDFVEGEKRQKVQEEAGDSAGRASGYGVAKEATLIRRLTVIFNSTGPTTSCDYIVTQAGVKGLPSEEKPIRNNQDWSRIEGAIPSDTRPGDSAAGQPDLYPTEKDYDDLWTDDELYEKVDWDALEQTLSQSQRDT